MEPPLHYTNVACYDYCLDMLVKKALGILYVMGSEGLGKYLVSGDIIEKVNPCAMGRARKSSKVGS